MGVKLLCFFCIKKFCVYQKLKCTKHSILSHLSLRHRHNRHKVFAVTIIADALQAGTHACKIRKAHRSLIGIDKP